MRALLLLALLLVASGSAPLASATLANSFCTSLANVTLPNDPFPDATMLLSSVCVTYINSTNFALSLSGWSLYKDVQLSAATSVCQGFYGFAQPQLITFAYDLSTRTYCSQPSTVTFGFCNWACAAFAGTYVPFFDNIAAPLIMEITPGPAEGAPVYSWGNLDYNLKLACNTSSCGSASNVVPPSPLPANASFTNFTADTGSFTQLNANSANISSLYINGQAPVTTVSASAPLSASGGCSSGGACSLSLLAAGPATVACQYGTETFDANGRFVGCNNGSAPVTLVSAASPLSASGCAGGTGCTLSLLAPGAPIIACQYGTEQFDSDGRLVICVNGSAPITSLSCGGVANCTSSGGHSNVTVPATPAVQCEYYVSLFGSDSTGTGSVSYPWRTITFANNNALVLGCILHIGPGNWTESWTAVDGATYIGTKPLASPAVLYGETLLSGTVTIASSASLVNLHFSSSAQKWLLSSTATTTAPRVTLNACTFTASTLNVTALVSGWAITLVLCSFDGVSVASFVDVVVGTRFCTFGSLSIVSTGLYSFTSISSSESVFNTAVTITSSISASSASSFVGGYLNQLNAVGAFVSIVCGTIVVTYVPSSGAPATISTSFAQQIKAAAIYDNNIRTMTGVSCTGCTSASNVNGVLTMTIPASTTYTGTSNQILLTGNVFSLPPTTTSPGYLAATTNFLGVGTTPVPLTLGPGVNCGSTVATQTYIGNNQYMILSVTTPVTGTCTGTIATLTFGAQTGINSAHMCNVMPGTTGSAGVAVAGTTTTFSFGTPTGGLSPNTAYIWYITGCGGF